MAKPKPPPLSIRPGDERLARIDAYAAEHKLSRHLAILLMLDEGYRSLTNPAPLPPLLQELREMVSAPPRMVRIAPDEGPPFVPLIERKAFNPQPKKGAKK